MIKITLIAVALLAAIALSGQASADPLCPGLTGIARTNCLLQERDRTAVIAARDNAYFESLNRSMEKACRAAEAADFAAHILSEGKSPQVMWAGRVWLSARALGAAASHSRDECERLQRERAQMRRR